MVSGDFFSGFVAVMVVLILASWLGIVLSGGE